MSNGWKMLGWGCVGAYGALTLLRCVADEMARTTRALQLLEKRERAAREKRNQDSDPVTIAERAA